MAEYFEFKYSFLIPLLPLIAAAISGFFGAKWLKGQSHWPIWLGVGASAVLSFICLFAMIDHMPKHAGHEGEAAESVKAEAHPAPAHGEAKSHDEKPAGSLPGVWVSKIFYTWAQLGDPAKAGTKDFLHVDVGFWFDPLTCVMMCVVFGIGFLITIFAAGYMKGETGYFRFFAYLGLFLFSMGCLVMGENLIMLYLGWEGVGLCSYLLIGYYYDKPAAREAAKKAFLVNRVGDFGFGLGIMLSFMAFGTVSYFGDGGANAGLLTLANSGTLTPFQQTAMQWLPFLLMIGAFGKSAQFPLYVWLPDAMEGPTPVSALIHAATMVTAGVYMIARCGTLFVSNEAAMMTVAIIGTFTAIFAGSIALRQYDLKKVFAYSTVSQLGFMFAGVGVLAPVAGVFHLITHAFFKALLFLSSGVVMHAMSGELDMRKMSGLKRALPQTRWLMLAGCLALAGFPFTSGFFSKDEIVAFTWDRSKVLCIVLLITAFMTAYYTFRLYFRVFAGPEVIPQPPEPDAHGHGHGHDSHGHDDHHGHNPESFLLMAPLWILLVGALASGVYLAQDHRLGHFLGQSPSFVMAADKSAKTYHGEHNPVPFGQEDNRGKDVEEAEHGLHHTFMILSSVISIAGIGLAYQFHLRNRAAADKLTPAFANVLDNKYWVDEIYQAGIVEPLRSLGRVFFAIDRILVDGIVGAIAFVPQLGGFALKLSVQRGYLQGYAAAMLFGIAAILLAIFL